MTATPPTSPKIFPRMLAGLLLSQHAGTPPSPPLGKEEADDRAATAAFNSMRNAHQLNIKTVTGTFHDEISDERLVFYISQHGHIREFVNALSAARDVEREEVDGLTLDQFRLKNQAVLRDVFNRADVSYVSDRDLIKWATASRRLYTIKPSLRTPPAPPVRDETERCKHCGQIHPPLDVGAIPFTAGFGSPLLRLAVERLMARGGPVADRLSGAIVIDMGEVDPMSPEGLKIMVEAIGRRLRGEEPRAEKAAADKDGAKAAADKDGAKAAPAPEATPKRCGLCGGDHETPRGVLGNLFLDILMSGDIEARPRGTKTEMPLGMFGPGAARLRDLVELMVRLERPRSDQDQALQRITRGGPRPWLPLLDWSSIDRAIGGNLGMRAFGGDFFAGRASFQGPFAGKFRIGSSTAADWSFPFRDEDGQFIGRTRAEVNPDYAPKGGAEGTLFNVVDFDGRIRPDVILECFDHTRTGQINPSVAKAFAADVEAAILQRARVRRAIGPAKVSRKEELETLRRLALDYALARLMLFYPNYVDGDPQILLDEIADEFDILYEG